jgi:hypothetical protein
MSTKLVAIAVAIMVSGVVPFVGADGALPEGDVPENRLDTNETFTRYQGSLTTVDGTTATVFTFIDPEGDSSSTERYTIQGVVPCGWRGRSTPIPGVRSHIRHTVLIECGPRAPSLSQQTVLIAAADHHYAHPTIFTTDAVWYIRLDGNWQGNIVIKTEGSEGASSEVVPVPASRDPAYGYGLMIVRVGTDYKTDFRLNLSLTGAAGAPPIASFSKVFASRPIQDVEVSITDWSRDASGAPNYFTSGGVHNKNAPGFLRTEFASGETRETGDGSDALDHHVLSSVPVRATMSVLGGYDLAATKAFGATPQSTAYHGWIPGNT